MEEGAEYVKPRDISDIYSVVASGHDNSSYTPRSLPIPTQIESASDYANADVKTTGTCRHVGLVISIGVAVAACVIAAIIVVVSSLNATAAVEALEKRYTTCGTDQIQGTTTGNNQDNANISLGTNDSKEKLTPDSACLFRKGYFPRQVVTLTDGYDVLCDTVSDGGGWILFQRRTSSDVDFNRNWQNYTDGFGDVTGNFWLGLDKVYNLCNQKLCELRLDFMYQGVAYYAEYQDFWLSGPEEAYTLNVGAYHGTAGDAMKFHTGQKFSTSDQDNDRHGKNCAKVYSSPWWYNSCGARVGFNGLWGSNVAYNGLIYYDKTLWTNSATLTEMKLRFGRRE